MATSPYSAFYVDFRGNTNFGGSGMVVSPIFDTESENFTTQWTNYLATVSTPTGTSVTWQFRAAATTPALSGAVWTASIAISALTGRYFQVRGIITKNDEYGITSGAIISDVAPFAQPQGQALMVEEATTNLVQRSQEFDNASWAKVTSSVVANCAIAPDGTATADKIVEDTSATTVHLVRQSAILTVSSPGTLSVYLKAGERTWAYIYNGTTVAYFNLAAGTVGSISSANGWTSGIKYAGNGWYRCWISNTSVASTSFDDFQIGVANGDIGSSYTGDGTSGIYVWGAQAEAKAYPTSYVPTTSATATRNAETINFPNTCCPSGNYANNSVVIRAYFSGDKLNPETANSGSTTYALITTHDTTGNNYLMIDRTSTLIRFITSNFAGATHSAQVTFSTSGIREGWNTLGWTISGNNKYFYINGTMAASGTTSNVPSAWAGNFNVGYYRPGNNRQWNDLISDVVVFGEALTNTEMLAYTATGAVIPLDYRTAYKLDFEGNLLHGEGGYRISPSIALDNMGTITGSTITWTETETASATTNIEWVQGTNVTITGNTVQKTGGTNGSWDAGAIGNIKFEEGTNFYIQYAVETVATSLIFGLNSGNNSTYSYTDMDLSMWQTGNDIVIYEHGVNKGTVATDTVIIGDILRIEVIDNIAKYYKNSTLLYTSLQPTIFWPMWPDVSINSSSDYASGAMYGYFPKVEVDTSIDNGTTWSAATSSGSITGLSSEVSAAGKTLLVRQKLTTPRSATSPSVQDVTVRMTQKWANTPTTYIKPVTTKLVLTPTNLTKWQLENKKYSTSFIDGTRNAETLTIPASGTLYASSGTVIVRAYVGGDSAEATVDGQHMLFDSGASAATNRIVLFQNTGTPGNYIARLYGASSTQTNASVPLTLSEGWHTFGVRWYSGRLSLYIDGAERGASTSVSLPSTFGTYAYIGSNSNAGTGQWDGQISQIDIFGEYLTDAEMTAYTAASGAVIPVGIKHTYQLLLNDSLEYGLTGVFTSRFHDAGANCTDTPWITFTKTESKPSGTNIRYFWGANNTGTGSVTYSEDITDCVGRYIKCKIYLSSDDVNAATPSVSAIRPIAQFI